MLLKNNKRKILSLQNRFGVDDFKFIEKSVPSNFQGFANQKKLCGTRKRRAALPFGDGLIGDLNAAVRQHRRELTLGNVFFLSAGADDFAQITFHFYHLFFEYSAKISK